MELKYHLKCSSNIENRRFGELLHHKYLHKYGGNFIHDVKSGQYLLDKNGFLVEVLCTNLC